MNTAPTATHRFRAVWPITDDTAPFTQLLCEATEDLRALAVQAHAVLCGRPRFTVARSCDVPGSGDRATYVLLACAPARLAPARAYRSTP